MFNVKLVTVGGVIVSVAVCEAPLNVPVIVTVVDALTPVVVIEKVAVVFPDATATEGGTVATPLLLDNATVLPDGPAGLTRVTVPVDDPPPTT